MIPRQFHFMYTVEYNVLKPAHKHPEPICQIVEWNRDLKKSALYEHYFMFFFLLLIQWKQNTRAKPIYHFSHWIPNNNHPKSQKKNSKNAQYSYCTQCLFASSCTILWCVGWNKPVIIVIIHISNNHSLATLAVFVILHFLRRYNGVD